MDNTTSENNNAPQENKSYVSLKFKKPKPLYIAIGGAVILIVAALFIAKGIFVAATVNGSPISRLSVIQELEKQGGKQALEAIIDKKLIETELDKQKIVATKEQIEAEIDTYIKDSKATTPKDMKIEDFRKQISEQLKGQKFQQEAQKWVADLTAKAKIKYYVNY